MILFYSMIYKNTKLIRNIIKRICKNKALAFTWNVKADTKVYIISLRFRHGGEKITNLC